jgi:atypical dual specificity phosphatase
VIGWGLDLRELSLGFGRHRVLDRVSFRVPATGITSVMGPGGGGKSALLRTLARRNERLPSFWCEGDAVLGDGRSLLRDLPEPEVQHRVPLLAQKAALYTASVLDNVIDAVRDPRETMGRLEKMVLARHVLEPVGLWERYRPLLDQQVLTLSIGDQRLLSIARLIAANPVCLLADEPFRDIDDEAAAAIRELLRHWSADHAVVLVEHNLQVARALSRRIVLVAGGRLIADQETEAFFTRPRSELARTFLRTGSCWPDEPASDDDRPVPARTGRPPPRGFHWIITGSLAGSQRPGLLGDENEDLAALRELGCAHLISLTLRPVDPELAGRCGMQAHHFPIEDMGVPTPVAAEHICRKVARWLAAREPVVFHCRAGLGRTGTMVACYLVYRGATAVSAVDEVRSVNPYYIQSMEQLDFIEQFQLHLRQRRSAG